MVEQLTLNQRVVGSSPTRFTKNHPRDGKITSTRFLRLKSSSASDVKNGEFLGGRVVCCVGSRPGESYDTNLLVQENFSSTK